MGLAIEEQTSNNGWTALHSATYTRLAQRLTIPNRKVVKLAFYICRLGAPTGDVYFRIRNLSDTVLMEQLWGDASELSISLTWVEVEFATLQFINEEVRISLEFSGGDASNCVRVRYQNSDVKADEHRSHYIAGWSHTVTYDFTYRYTYSVWSGKVSGVTNPAKVKGVDKANIAKVQGVVSA